MLKQTWLSVFIGASILTAIIFSTLVLTAPDVNRSAKDIFFGIISIYIAVFFVLSISMLIITQIKVFNAGDKQDKILMILAFVFALAYVLPKVIAKFKNN